MPLWHPQMIAILREAACQYWHAINQGCRAIVLAPGGFADFGIEYGVGNQPVHTGLWIKRQLVRIGVPEDAVIWEPVVDVADANVVDSSTETEDALVLLSRYLGEGDIPPNEPESCEVDVVIPANRPHGRRLRMSWGAITRRLSRLYHIRTVQVVKISNLMGIKWTILDVTLRWLLWVLDPLCKRFPSRLILEGRRRKTASIVRNEAQRRTAAGDYDINLSQ